MPIVVDRKGPATRGPATSPRVAGGAGVPASTACSALRSGSRTCSKRCSSRRARREPFEPHDAAAAVPRRAASICASELTFTIDPETAKDFDDALTLEGEDRAYVHIADVSYFVPAGTPLDHGAAARAFSTYVPGLVAPMLPPELSEDLCSLRPHDDRLCVTVEIPLDGGEPSFYRSVIRSDARLTYGQAEAILAGRERRGAGADRGAAARRAALDRAARPALRARRAADRDAGDRVRLRRPRRRRSAPGARASRTRTCSSRS